MSERYTSEWLMLHGAPNGSISMQCDDLWRFGCAWKAEVAALKKEAKSALANYEMLWGGLRANVAERDAEIARLRAALEEVDRLATKGVTLIRMGRA